MNTQTTHDLTALSDAELSRQLTDCRITLESIYPYRCKATSAKRAALWAEVKRRDAQIKRNEPLYVDPDGNPHYA